MQHSYEIQDGTGATVRAEMNKAIQALSTLSGGNTAPETAYPGMFWFDTQNNKLMRRDADNVNWAEVEMGSTFDPTAVNESIEAIQAAIEGLQGGLESFDISSVNAAITALQTAVEGLQNETGSSGVSLSDVFTSDDWVAIESGFEDLSSRMGDISTALTEIIGGAI